MTNAAKIKALRAELKNAQKGFASMFPAGWDNSLRNADDCRLMLRTLETACQHRSSRALEALRDNAV